MLGRLMICLLAGLLFHDSAEAACEKAYSAGSLSDDMTALTTAIRAKDKATLAAAGARLSEGLPCTSLVLPVPALASAYRFIGVHHAMKGEDAQAARFFRVALELDPSFEWGVNDLAGDDPIRVLFEGQRKNALSEPVRLEGKVFTVPAGSAVWIDGRQAREVEATVERPHLVQVVANNTASATYLIDGISFPSELIGEQSAQVATTGKKGGPVRVERQRPPAKTPLLIVGATGMVAGAGLYAASFASRSSFDSATTTSDVMKYQTSTNALVIASGTSLLVGLGAGYVGFILDGRPGLIYRLSY